jgi:hypothetical protein
MEWNGTIWKNGMEWNGTIWKNGMEWNGTIWKNGMEWNGTIDGTKAELSELSQILTAPP